ncbi:Fic family protein [Mesorhizobium japonicum]|uniref:Mlr2757 protein n=1 Tax=Mesorhizobium japonicum (strain LMG 29417 / CECT 9101 / MAFF 303099) TaxID=266835 RepID=Q98HQ8_RHILO|nr:Fic family protein [Mesorhizobium japonicum]BAB49808.1 mlr2757 [Mesorhizobium japonicum MAFF 303099]
MTPAGTVFAKKRQLDALRKRGRPGALDGLEHSQRIDITYTSNAIEGNTLTAGETALVLEKGITISGKPLKDHLEAVDHARALNWVLEIASQSSTPIVEADIRNLHHLVVANTKPEIAGRYADSARYVNTDAGVYDFPPPMDVPALMERFCQWLGTARNTPQTAFEAHRRLVDIHPFNDGNGRTARLLMNLVLARAGYPPVAIRPEDRPAYIAALETAQRGGGHAAFDRLLFDRLDQTLDMYLDAARQAQASSAEAGKVIPIRS